MNWNANDPDPDHPPIRRPKHAGQSTEPGHTARRTAPRIDAWLGEPLAPDVKRAIARLSRAPDVQRIAVMPDVHLAEGVCVGNVVATTHLIYPQAVGGDIGCGMTAVAFDISAADIRREPNARALLAAMPRIVPAMRWPSLSASPYTPSSDLRLSPALHRELARLGRIEFGTLGRGNHFLELQSDEAGQCWAMVHSGSRCMGQAITRHHLKDAKPAPGGLHCLDAETGAGRAYLSDAAWAENYAAANRLHMLAAVANWMSNALGANVLWKTRIDCSHNHVRREFHSGTSLWVHRKGAMPAHADQPGIIPGSMGTMSVHVEGRGHSRSLCSSAHGAGRMLSRDAARRRISAAALQDAMRDVWFAEELTDRLRDEAPAAYKDIRRVLRAQRELVRVVRRLTPILVYKGV